MTRGNGRAAKAAAATLAIVAVSVIAAGSAAASSTTIYSNFPTPLPANVPSVGFEATSAAQFGGEIEPTTESLTTTKVTVGMSSWACQSGSWTEHNCTSAPGAKFEWPVTLHIHAVGPGNTVGTEVARLTQAFKMPYRPSDSPRCEGNGWFSQGSCYHGKLFKIAFNLRGVALPQPAIVSVSYNTSDYGAHPTGCTGACPYDSLNVAVEEGPEATPPPTGASIGSQPAPADAFLNSSWGGAYCNEAEGTGTFRLDPGCWTDYQPLLAVETS